MSHLSIYRLLLVIGLSLSVSSTFLLAQCVSGNCQRGEGLYRYVDGRQYYGEFRDGRAHGEGTLTYPNGERYQGQFHRGQLHGKGIYRYPDGSSRSGTWRHGVLSSGQDNLATTAGRSLPTSGCIQGDCEDGKGTYLTPGGAIYVGDFRSGEIHGQGICTYTDGSRYEGQWSHRHPEGYGHKTWADGRSFTGQWRRGFPVNSDGVYQYPDGALTTPEGTLVIQSGCLQGDCKNGQGVYAYADGSRYEGQFRSGRPNGSGTFSYPNGDWYQGQFLAGLPHGYGVLQAADGSRLEGQWSEGGFLSNPDSSGGQTGCLAGNCDNGYGTYRFQQGDIYEGAFRAGLPEGTGLVRYQNGDRYEGAMSQGAFNGYGTFYAQDGGIFQGLWRDGKYQGNTQITAGASATPKVRTWALIVGVSSYRHMPALRFPDDDAYQLYAFLKSPQGGAIPDDRIRILIDEDATRRRILLNMRELFLRASPDDLVILYFSGHGLPGAFLPIDYDGTNNSLAHTEVRQILEQSAAGYKLCLADACHSGGLIAARAGGLPAILTRYYEDLSATQRGTALIMSSKAEETSLEDSGLRQGVFSHFLLRGLKGEADQDMDGVVRVQELFRYVNQQVKQYTGHQQQPVIQGNYDERMPVAVVR
ncbi:MAG: caspase family protein [Bacteroidota bacterium]